MTKKIRIAIVATVAAAGLAAGTGSALAQQYGPEWDDNQYGSEWDNDQYGSEWDDEQYGSEWDNDQYGPEWG